MSQSLYRTYRSRSFDEVVGQRHVTDLLSTAVKSGAISHAYLFTGPRGTGKTSVARILAHEINHLPYDDDNTHLDIIEIDAASNRRIDDIRDLREKVYIAPSSAKYKVYIIDEVHMLTGESFNALLKTLEEPPEHAVFILATTELHKVPATIISRTQRFHFRPGSTKDIVAHLRNIASKETIAIDDDALQLIAEHSDGGFRDSVSLLDQASSLSDEIISRADIESLLGLAPSQVMQTILDDIINNRPLDAIPRINELIDNGIHPHSVAEQLLKAAAESALDHPQLYSLIGMLLDSNKSHLPQLRLITSIASLHTPGVDTPQNPLRKHASNEPIPPTVEKLIAPTTPTTHRETPPPKPAPKSQPRSPKELSKVSSAQPTDFSWDVVTLHLKKAAPALYSVVKHAIASYTDKRLELSFHYALHRKKMESDKYRNQLMLVLEELYGTSPELYITADTPTAFDTKTAAIADIMGGGESVQVPTDEKQ